MGEFSRGIWEYRLEDGSALDYLRVLAELIHEAHGAQKVGDAREAIENAIACVLKSHDTVVEAPFIILAAEGFQKALEDADGLLADGRMDEAKLVLEKTAETLRILIQAAPGFIAEARHP